MPGTVWVSDGTHTVPIESDQLAKILGVSTRTIQRYASSDKLPCLVEKVLRYEVLGYLPHKTWQQWRIDSQGALWSPNGHD